MSFVTGTVVRVRAKRDAEGIKLENHPPVLKNLVEMRGLCKGLRKDLAKMKIDVTEMKKDVIDKTE